MSSASIIDMSKLPAPQVVQVIDFEDIFAEMKADLIAEFPSVADVLELESEPLTVLLQRFAYQTLLRRQRENESALAVMLAYAEKADLDQLAAFYGVTRLTLVEADPQAIPPVPAVMESDDDFRERIQLAPQGFSVAGPVGAYVFHARSADGQVLDASATSLEPGQVTVSVLSREGDGTASLELLAIVGSALTSDEVRPMTDEVIVQSAEIIEYQVTATIYTMPGPDSSSVISTSEQRIAAYVKAQHRMGRSPTLSGIYAALHVEGMHHVTLVSPVADIPVGITQAAWCSAINLTHGGTVG